MSVDVFEDGAQSMTAEALVTDEPDRQHDSLLETIRAARAGDSAAFEEIMLLTERRVAQLAWRILGDADEVKDAVQETFLRLFRHLRRYDETKQDLQAWLNRIAMNVCLDQLRRRKRRRIFEPLDDAPTVATGDLAADEELIRRADVALLRRAIESLPPKERLAVMLRDVEGLSTHEVASALGNTVATVRVQLSRARVKLRRFVEAWRGKR